MCQPVFNPIDAVREGGYHVATDPGRQHERLATGYVGLQQFLRAGKELDAGSIDRHGLVAGTNQRGEPCTCPRVLAQNPRAAHHQAVQPAADKILATEIVFAQGQPRNIVHHTLFLPAHGGLDTCRGAPVGGNQVRQQLNPPRLHQWPEVRCTGGRNSITHLFVIRRLLDCQVALGKRVEKGQYAATTQHVLVDGKQRLLIELLRMHDHEHIDIVRNRFRCTPQILYIERTLYLGQDEPLLRLAKKYVGRPAIQRQFGDQSNHLLLRVRQAVDQPGQFILQRFFLLRLEIGYRAPFPGGIHPRHPEIGKASCRIDRYSLEAVVHRLGLFVRERLRIFNHQFDLAVSQRGVLLEQFPYPLAVGRDCRRATEQLLGKIETQGDFLIEISKDVLCTLGQGVQAVRCHIETLTLEEYPRSQVDDDQKSRHCDQARPGK